MPSLSEAPLRVDPLRLAVKPFAVQCLRSYLEYQAASRTALQITLYRKGVLVSLSGGGLGTFVVKPLFPWGTERLGAEGALSLVFPVPTQGRKGLSLGCSILGEVIQYVPTE